MAENERATEFVAAILLEAVATPFFEEGTRAVFDGFYIRAAIAYGVGAIPAIAGLLTVANYWPRLRTRAGGWLVAHMEPIAISPRWWFGVMLFVLLWLSWPELVRKFHRSLTPVSSPNPIEAQARISPPPSLPSVRPLSVDLRTLPLAPGSTFLPLVPHFDESVAVWCFQSELSSCAIALEYRDRLAQGFTMRNWHVKDDGGNNFEFLVGMSHLHGADFKGIKIDTLTDQYRPDGAKELLKNLQALGVPADFGIDNQENLGPNDFEIWIGGKP
jgi:hypothetical protein